MQVPFGEALKQHLAAPCPYPQDRFSGRGIVTCAGGKRYFTCVWMLIWALRRVVGSTLPIQVWHLGRAEMSEGMQLILEEEGVEVIDAEQVVGRYPARVSGGWPLKPYAIAQSRFREVIFLDADVIPLGNPDAVFEWDIYTRHGVLFWPDIVDLMKQNKIWTMTGLEPKDRISVESGVLVVDKQRAWGLLDLAMLMNEHWEEVYEFIHGDKDSYLIGAELLRQDFSLIEHRPYQFDNDLIQRDPQGEPFLHHRSLSKWNLAGPNRPVFGDANHETWERALEELRRRWSGAVFHPPTRSAASLAEENRLIAARWFHYSTSVAQGRTLELLPGGRVGEGRAQYEQHWAVVEQENHLVLQFYSDTQLTVKLLGADDGAWKGVSISLPAFDASLVYRDASQTWPHFLKARVDHSGAIHVDAILTASLLRVGFDGEIARELREALSLLNRLFDDVPEAISRHLSGTELEQQWHAAVKTLAAELAKARDTRLANANDRARHPVAINPEHYRRIS